MALTAEIHRYHAAWAADCPLWAYFLMFMEVNYTSVGEH